MSVPAETNRGEVTSWIPLTSTFTPSAGCESIFRLNGPSLVAFDPGYGLDIDRTVKCAPSAVTTWWEQARLGVGGDDHTALSILPLICPHEWTTVGSFLKDKSTTQIMCCPSGYSNQQATEGPVNGNCVSSISKGMVLTYASTADFDSEDWSIATTTMTDSSSVGAIAVVGYNVARATSSPTSSSSRSSSSSTSPSFSNTTPSQTSAVPAPTNSSPTQEDGMSTGLKVGIALGVTLGVIGIASLIFAMIMLRRRSQKKAQGPDAAAPVQISEHPNKPPVGDVHPAAPQYYQPVYELHGHYEPNELPPVEVRSPVEMGHRF